MASGSAPPGQVRAALIVVLVAFGLTIGLLPLAKSAGPVMPGFFLVHQTALIVIYGLSASMLFTQFLRSRAAILLLAGSGTLFTAAIVTFQLLSLPGVFMPARIIGAGPETTTWLWTGWHVGPPVWGLLAVALLAWRPDYAVPARFRRMAAILAGGLALALAAAWTVFATVFLPWLPAQTNGDDYSALVASGVGPAVEALTIAALAALVLVTRRRRSTLDLWIITALTLLVLDNALTMVGAARGSVGWIAGRVLALASAGAVIRAYLHEVESLRASAEAALEGLAATEAKLRASQKMEAIGQLTGGIAHDFNNLLMVVTSGFDMIRRRPDDRARVIKMAEAGLEATERGARLTRQLLTFARRQSLRPETVDPNMQLSDFERLAARAAGESVTLRYDLDPAIHPVLMDTSEFEAAVLNLVVNARDALAPKGGRVTIQSRNAVLAAPAGPLEPGGYVVVSVTDSGPGMTEDVATRAFEPFFTTKDFGRGSGLGLSQVYGFARAAGGEAVIQTAPSRGTTVELWLPRAYRGQSATRVETRDHDSPLRQARAGEVVLAVEDEPDVLATVIENLADLGYQVISARDAAEALERLAESDQRIDILFSDVVMPGGMNGVRLAEAATLIRPQLRVLLTSGYTNHALEGEHDLPPNLEILTKPYRRADLATRLRLVT